MQKQILKGFAKTQIPLFSITVWLGKVEHTFLKYVNYLNMHCFWSFKINDRLNQNLSFNLQHGKYWWINQNTIIQICDFQ